MSINGMEIICLHCEDGTSDKFYAVRIDNVGGSQPFQVVSSHGPAASPRAQGNQVKGSFATIDMAKNVQERLALEKTRKGYININHPGYRGRLRTAQVLEKIDTSRLIGYNGVTTEVTVTATIQITQTSNTGSTRAGRSIRI